MPHIPIDQVLRTALQHHQAGRYPEAETLYRQTLAQQPHHAPTLHLYGALAGQTGRPAMAIEMIRRAISVGPAEAVYYSNLAKFLMDQGHAEEAIAAARQAVQLKPDLADAHYNLANALHLHGAIEEAVTAYRQALRLNPTLPAALKNLATALRDLGRLDQAIPAYQDALRLRPDLPEIHINLGIALRMDGQLDPAITSFREALRLQPRSAQARNNLGHALQLQGHFEEAVACYQQAIELEPTLAHAHNNLGSALKELGEMDQSVASYRQAVALKPDDAALHSNLLLALNYHPASTRQSLFHEATRWHERHAAPFFATHPSHPNDRTPDRPLRIGYVSADFRRHASAYFLMPLLQHHDPQRVEVICYADVPRPDEITRQFQQLVPHWRNTAALSDDRLAILIREDRIDILIDLKLHADHNRLLVFARKPAPVQATWLGYPGTTGLSAIDYRLTDPHLDPPNGSDDCYSEQTLRLPETFWCYDPLAAGPLVNALPAATAGHITFGCLNHFSKIHPPLLQLWAGILQATPNSRLLMLAPEGAARARVLKIVEQAGIDPARIEFTRPLSREYYLQLYHRIDLGLDSWPVNGHTTSLDSFWMGVPVVTLTGPTPLGRAGLSQLLNLLLPDLIAHTPEAYQQIACTLAADLPRLAALRSGLRTRLQSSPLTNGPRFAQAMELAYRQMWHHWCPLPK